jgi:iron complex transport system substrate-binding protein
MTVRTLWLITSSNLNQYGRDTKGTTVSMRIVSLLPSSTEIVCALGLGDMLVGVTHECDYPPFVKNLPRVTKTLIPQDASSSEIDALVRERLKTKLALYSLDMPVLMELQPDLLITQALCDVCAVAEAEVTEAACRLPGHPKVINLEPMSLNEVFETMLQVGEATDYVSQAKEAAAKLQARVDKVTQRTSTILKNDHPRVAFLEWIDPPFCPGHWNPELIEMAGGIDVLGAPNKPSRTLAWQEVIDSSPDVLFISCCGFGVERTMLDIPILQSLPGYAELPAVKNNRVYVTDGNSYFSRPGPRLVDSLEILAHTLHPGIHAAPENAQRAIRVVME